MIAKTCLFIAAAFLALAGVCFADGSAPSTSPAESQPKSLLERDTLTDNWFGLGGKLSDKGIAARLSLTQIYQHNVSGGLDTTGRCPGSYDLELDFDLEKLAGLKGARIYTHAEGSWSDGLDPVAVGSIFGTNADALGDHAIEVTELYFEQSLFDGKLQFRIGKLDLTGCFQCRGCPVSFDGNSFANDETTEFLNGALVNNPTIPFPDRGLGIILHAQLTDWWYASAGVGDARADDGETGFHTTFGDDAEFFSIFETGVTPVIASRRGPLQGAYRVGVWYDPQDKPRFRGHGTKSDDAGAYLSFDQMVWRENDDKDDTQGLGLFARCGVADADVNIVESFWSIGFQYQGLIPSRNNDVLALGLAQGRLSPDAGFSASHETALELYYSAGIAPWLSISPDIQYIIDPGGNKHEDHAFVVGLRVQMAF